MMTYDARWAGSPVDVEPKDPTSNINYAWDWTAWLADRGDTIASSTWTASDGLTVAGSSIDGNVTKVVLQGGVAGYTYIVTNRMTTTAGLVEPRSMRIVCQEK